MKSLWRMAAPAVFLTLFVAIGGAAAALQPRGDRPVAVVMTPWQDFGSAAAAVGRAGGAIKSVGGVDWIVVTDRGGRAFIESLRRHGAFLVIDAEAAQGCLSLT